MKKYLGSCAMGALIVYAAPVYAQASSAAPTAAEGRGNSGFEEIVVTAQKRVENVQDIPKSVQVVAATQLRENNITELDDLRKIVPSISGAGLSIRGVASNASSIGAQSKVGIVLDDVPQPSRATLANNLLDIERVEVLPGPQGTLSGRNATGGLINMVTRSPSMSGFSGNASVLVTDDHQVQAGAYITGPISDTLAFSVSGYENYFRGLSRNTKNNMWRNTDTHGIRAKLLFKPDDRLSVTLTGYYQRSYSQPGGIGSDVYSFISKPQDQIFSPFDVRTPGRTMAQLKPGVTPGPNNIDFYSEVVGNSVTKDYGGILRLEYEVGGATITSITSYLREKNPQLQPFLGISLVDMNFRPEFDGYAHVYNETDYKTQEIRIASSKPGPLQYVAGVFYSDNTNTYDYVRYFFPVNWERDFGQTSMAAFGHLQYELPTGTTIQGGLRYESNKVNYQWIFNPILATTKTTANGTVINFPLTNVASTSAGNDKQDFVNYDFGVQQKLTDDVMAYVIYSKASQGIVYDAEDNTVAVKGKLSTLPAERVRNVEVGLKTAWFNNRLIFNINYFNGKYDNYQVSTLTFDATNPNAVPVLKLAAVGKVRTEGVEATANVIVNDWLRINSNLSYTNAKIIDFPNAPCFQNQTAAQGCLPAVAPLTGTNQGNLAGKSLASTPKWNIVISPSVNIPIGSSDWKFFGSTTYRYQSKQNTDLLGNPLSSLAAASYVNASIGVSNKTFRFELIGNNLTNTSRETFSNTLWGFSGASVLVRNLARNNYRYFGARAAVNF